MKNYTQAELDALISCAKTVSEAPRQTLKLDRGSYRNDLKLVSENEEVFSVFMRINESFQENFSIGLVYHPADEPRAIVLLRCNGRHGEHTNAPAAEPIPHYDYHVHTAQADLMSQGQAPERFAEITQEYASYEEALAYFVGRVNIQEAHKFFSNLPQLLPLFNQRSES